jgi:hypothetical protein
MISRYHVTRIGASFLVGCGFSASPEWVIDRTTLEPISYRHFRFSREPPTPPWIPSVQFKLPQFRSYFRQEDQDSHTIPVRVLPAKCKVSGVEPRGFEPLTSAVQRQVYRFTRVHYGTGSCITEPFLDGRTQMNLPESACTGVLLV